MQSRMVPAGVVLLLGALVPGCSQDAPPMPAVGASPDAKLVHAQADDPGAGHVHGAALPAGSDFPLPQNHVPWTPDAPLIEGMSRVRSAIGALESHQDEADVLARADDIDAAVRYMFENCRLDTEPDIALHAILARLMAASRALHENPADTTPVRGMHAAVENYERLFDDPGGPAGGL